MVARRLRIVFFGTPAFAVPTLEALLASAHEVVGVVTQPDRPRGRGQRTSNAPVKQTALAHGVPVAQPERLRDPLAPLAPLTIDPIAAWRPDLGVVAAYGKILPDTVLQLPPLGLINVHASLLPAYRGAAPVHRAVIAGEAETGVTIMRVVRELDAGPMLAATRRPIAPDETSADVERALAQLGAALLVEIVDALARGPVRETPQDERYATYAPRLTREEGLLDWSAPAAALHHRIRGLHPWPHAYTFLPRAGPADSLRQGYGGPPKLYAKAEAGRHVDSARLVILRSQRPGSADDLDDAARDAAPGTVLEAAGDRLRVRTGDGVLRLLEVQPDGRRAMSARDFLAARRDLAGARFGALP